MERLWRGARNVSCGSIATETRCPNYVRSSLDSDLIAGALTRLKSANFLTHAPQNLLPFTVPLISPRSRLACGLAKLSRGCSVGRSPDTADLNPGPADIMSDVRPQMTADVPSGPRLPGPPDRRRMTSTPFRPFSAWRRRWRIAGGPPYGNHDATQALLRRANPRGWKW